MNIRAFGFTLDELTSHFSQFYGKGFYHAEAFFRHLYSTGNSEIQKTPEFLPSADFAHRLASDFGLDIPAITQKIDEGNTTKFTLSLENSGLTESVLIPMDGWSTLCVSSQIGCARACAFCETAKMGLVRNLRAEEIITQWAAARFLLGEKPRNIVYMGMGEPFDNFDELVRSVRILSDPRGPGIPKRRISISTSGQVEGIRRLTEMERTHPNEAWRTIHLAVSINAPNDELRNRLMPINRHWPLAELKKALLDSPQSRIKDALYFEYVLIPGVNDQEKHAKELIEWTEGLIGKVNLIPYHPTGSSAWEEPGSESLDRFHRIIRQSGRECRTRKSRGKGIEAACGMLGRAATKYIAS